MTFVFYPSLPLSFYGHSVPCSHVLLPGCLSSHRTTGVAGVLDIRDTGTGLGDGSIRPAAVMELGGLCASMIPKMLLLYWRSPIGRMGWTLMELGLGGSVIDARSGV